MLFLAWSGGFTTKSDYARFNADQVAIAASEGWITTMLPGGGFGRSWYITLTGLAHLLDVVNDQL